jgi:uncharacterized protein YunC (DUF1805 family)
MICYFLKYLTQSLNNVIVLVKKLSKNLLKGEQKMSQIEVDQITVNGKTYYANKITTEVSGDYKIVILQRGWIMVGKLERNGYDCKLHNASVIRSWGTTKGLGELVNGPLSATKLDKCHGVVEFDYLTLVASLCIDVDKWKNSL